MTPKMYHQNDVGLLLLGYRNPRDIGSVLMPTQLLILAPIIQIGSVWLPVQHFMQHSTLKKSVSSYARSTSTRSAGNGPFLAAAVQAPAPAVHSLPECLIDQSPPLLSLRR